MSPRARYLPILLAVTGWPGTARAQTHTALPRLSYSFHVGSAHPLSLLDSISDANIHANIDVTYGLAKFAPTALALNGKLLVGLSQFTAESFAAVPHPRYVNASINLQIVSPPSVTGLRHYLQFGPGIYWPKAGPAKPGANIGIGEQVPLGGVFRIEFGLDYHQVFVKQPPRFLTLQLGVVYH